LDEDRSWSSSVFGAAASNGELVVPVEPKAHVSDDLAAFAITIEKPDDGVVPKQARLVVLAPLR